MIMMMIMIMIMIDGIPHTYYGAITDWSSSNADPVDCQYCQTSACHWP